MVRIVSYREGSTADFVVDGVYEGVSVCWSRQSVVERQVYEEVREGSHRIIFLSGEDIAERLTANGINTRELVSALLQREFPVTGGQSWKQRMAGP